MSLIVHVSGTPSCFEYHNLFGFLSVTRAQVTGFPLPVLYSFLSVGCDPVPYIDIKYRLITSFTVLFGDL